MTNIRIINQDGVQDRAFSAACHTALDALLAKGVVTVTFLGEGIDGQALHLESTPSSYNLQLGSLMRFGHHYLAQITDSGDGE